MRVGIMGGTLDPIHNGHLEIAAFAKEYLRLDSIMLLPAGDPPHKHRLTDKADRLEMTRLAAASREGMFACDMEVKRAKTTFTVDTLRELTEREPETQWYYIVGADTLSVLDSWRDFATVAKLCVFAVIGRGSDAPAEEDIKRLSETYDARFEIVPFSGPDISSTDIRKAIAEGRDVSAMVPEAVNAYIREKGLYLCGMSIERIKKELKKSLKPGRYVHTIGVAETAQRLAPRFGVDAQRAYLAGLLHDCAKYMPLEDMQKSVKENLTDWDDEELSSVSLAHAAAGRVMAEQVFGVRDPQILSAIRRHTLGGANMSAMDALIYTTDFIEPNRKPFDGLDDVRALAEKDIFAATRLCTELTLKYVKEQGKRTHPRVYEILNTEKEENK